MPKSTKFQMFLGWLLYVSCHTQLWVGGWLGFGLWRLLLAVLFSACRKWTFHCHAWLLQHYLIFYCLKYFWTDGNRSVVWVIICVSKMWVKIKVKNLFLVFFRDSDQQHFQGDYNMAQYGNIHPQQAAAHWGQQHPAGTDLQAMQHMQEQKRCVE